MSKWQWKHAHMLARMHAHSGLITTSVSKCPRCPQSITNVRGPARLCPHKYPLTCFLLARLSSLLLTNLKRDALWDSYVNRDQQAAFIGDWPYGLSVSVRVWNWKSIHVCVVNGTRQWFSTLSPSLALLLSRSLHLWGNHCCECPVLSLSF